MNRLGIIPAAGTAVRFGGQIKELLPVGLECLIDKTIVSMFSTAEVILVVTNARKIGALVNWLERDERLLFAIQKGNLGLWSAIIESFPIAGDLNLMVFPDTYYPQDIFDREFASDFNLILFETYEPERFGVVADGAIWNKSDLYTGRQHAYGSIVWSREVVEFWKDHLDVIADYTHAFNMAMTEFGYKTYHMDYYYDMATFENYVAFLRERQEQVCV